MRFGFDVAACPKDPAQLEALAAEYTFAGVYIGGPSSAGSGYDAASVAVLDQTFSDGLLPIYVCEDFARSGYKDGFDAIDRLRALNLQPGCICALDVEADAYAANPAAAKLYYRRWARALRDSGYQPGVYSNAAGARDLGPHGNFTWLAVWDALDPAVVLNEFWAWQYSNGRVVGGIAVDEDMVADESASQLAHVAS